MPKKNTTTSSFGSPGRAGHDSTPFYTSRLYEDHPQPQEMGYQENPVPSDRLNTILCKSSEQMAELPDNSIHLMVTSPPYNVGKDYDENLNLVEYLGFLKRVWAEAIRVLVPGGRACINVANLGRKPYIPLHAFIVRDMLELGYLMRGEIIWNKAASASSSTAWGSWLSAVNPTLRDVHEYILIFSKGKFNREKSDDRSDTQSKEEFLELTKSVWHIGAESAKKVGHPAPFPIELPRRLIQLYTFTDEVILDPFMGSGQTAIATLMTSRNYVGYEVNAKYVSLARKRIRQWQSDNNPGGERLRDK